MKKILVICAFIPLLFAAFWPWIFHAVDLYSVAFFGKSSVPSFHEAWTGSSGLGYAVWPFQALLIYLVAAFIIIAVMEWKDKR